MSPFKTLSSLFGLYFLKENVQPGFLNWSRFFSATHGTSKFLDGFKRCFNFSLTKQWSFQNRKKLFLRLHFSQVISEVEICLYDWMKQCSHSLQMHEIQAVQHRDYYLVLGAICSYSPIWWVCYSHEVPFQSQTFIPAGSFSIFARAMIKTSVSAVLTTTLFRGTKCPTWKRIFVSACSWLLHYNRISYVFLIFLFSTR